MAPYKNDLEYLNDNFKMIAAKYDYPSVPSLSSSLPFNYFCRLAVKNVKSNPRNRLRADPSQTDAAVRQQV